MITSFKESSLGAKLIKALDELGFTQPTEIQAKALPKLLETASIDFHGQAQTGTGKTLAFGLPLLHHVDANTKHVQGLVVAPTRELVVQITQSLQEVAKHTSVTITPIYGGVSMHDQIRALKKGIHIVVATPGRLNDHLRRKTLKLDSLKTLVLDEADIMLDMGFKEEIDEILGYTPKGRNIWLFSATVKGGIDGIKKTHMHNPVSVRVSKTDVGNKKVKQYFCMVPSRHRMAALARFIDQSSDFYGLIFCPTKILTAEVAELLLKRGYKASALHGDMNQAARNRVIKRFKEQRVKILVATDVAARGIDVANLTHVINYCIPEDLESYVHRIGRTGRAGKEGIAITFTNPSELRRLKRLQQHFKLTINPIDVPSVEDIARVRVQEAAEYMALSSHRSKQQGAYLTNLRDLVAEYDHGDLVNVVVNSLHDLFFRNLKQEQDITFTPACKAQDMVKAKHLDTGHEEVALSVGSDDRVNKGDLVAFLRQHANITARDLGKIKVIKRRSFIGVPSAMVNRVIHTIDGKKLGGRKVRARRTGE